MPVRIRKQIYIDPEQDRGLKKLARRSGRTEADIVREAISAVLEQHDDQRIAAIENIEEFIRGLIRQGPIESGRIWRREDLYDRGAKKSA